MLARCARVEPALVRASPGSVNLISSFLSVCTTDTPAPSGRLSEPLAPLIVTAVGWMVAVTPAGSSTGALAILDIWFSYALTLLRRRCTAPRHPGPRRVPGGR